MKTITQNTINKIEGIAAADYDYCYGVGAFAKLDEQTKSIYYMYAYRQLADK